MRTAHSVRARGGVEPTAKHVVRCHRSQAQAKTTYLDPGRQRVKLLPCPEVRLVGGEDLGLEDQRQLAGGPEHHGQLARPEERGLAPAPLEDRGPAAEPGELDGLGLVVSVVVVVVVAGVVAEGSGGGGGGGGGGREW